MKKFLSFYATMPTIAKAATQAGISREHVFKVRRNDPEFRRAMEEIDNERLEMVRGALTGLIDKAVRVVEELLSADSENIRLRAASLIVGPVLGELRDQQVEDKLRRIEETLGNQKPSGGWTNGHASRVSEAH